MALTLRLRAPLSLPLEVDGFVPEVLRTLSIPEIERRPVQQGNRSDPLGEFFTVQGSAAEDSTVVWEGDLSRVKWLGAGQSGGTTRVEGHAGPHAGSTMSGGQVHLNGNADDWAGAEMSGGLLRIRGNVGKCLGGAYRGGLKGMTGGEILVHGDALDEVGQALRRGTIAVGGSAGAAVGFGMLAGNIVIGGGVGRFPGAGMKRGTIALFDANLPELLPTFHLAATVQPTFLRVLLMRLKLLGLESAEQWLDLAMQRYCGDLLELGKGEILLRAAG